MRREGGEHRQDAHRRLVELPGGIAVGGSLRQVDAIIRHRLMDVRLVIHRGLTLTLALAVSLVPVVVLLAMAWPRLSDHLNPEELVALIAAVVAVGLLIPLTRDAVGRLLDRYVYRTHVNYQRTLREARVLAEQLQRALNSRVVIEQAKGALAERAKINLDEAFDLLRTHARSHNLRLHDVATAAISSLLTVEELASPLKPRSSPDEG